MENKLADITLQFSVDILKFTDNIKGHYYMLAVQFVVC